MGREQRPAGEAAGLGQVLAQDLGAVLAELPGRGEAPDEIYGDLNGERDGTEEWGFAALRLSRALGEARLRPGGLTSWGDSGAASGALLAVLALEARWRGYARGPRSVLWARSEGGLRAAALLVESVAKERGEH